MEIVIEESKEFTSRDPSLFDRNSEFSFVSGKDRMKVGRGVGGSSTGLKSIISRLYNRGCGGGDPSVDTSFVDESNSISSSTAYRASEQVDSHMKLTGLQARNENNS